MKKVFKQKKIINVICKILLIFSFLFIVAELLEEGKLIIFPSVILITTTMGILKTEEKKNNIFLILGSIAIGLTLFLPIAVMFGSIFVTAFIKLFGGFNDVSIIDIIIKTPQLILTMQGGILSLVVLIIIGISFIAIHKKQKTA